MRRFLTLVSLFPLLSLSACDGTQPTEPDTPAPSFQILDATLKGGNPHFFWLPPMTKRPSYAGTFDQTAAPVVEICAWEDGCVEEPIERFEMALGPGSEGIRVVPWRRPSPSTVA